LETSTPNSAPRFFQGRFLWILLSALGLSLILYWAFGLSNRAVDGAGEAAPDAAAQTEPLIGETMIGVQPASFQQISEYKDGELIRLRLAGDAEPDAVIILTNLGERLRQVKVNGQGQWGVTIDVDSGPMVLEAQLYTDEKLSGVRSEETVFRLPVPEGEDVVSDYYATPALIMVTAPGSPSRIIQSPFGDVPTSGPLGLSVIDYDHLGGVIITGSSSIQGRIRIYAQDAVIGETVIGETGIGVSGRWNYIAGRMLPAREIEIKAELLAAQGIPDAPEGPTSISVPFNFLPPLQEEETDGSGALSVNFDPKQWQVRRTLIGGGGQSTVIFSPDAAISETLEPDISDPASAENDLDEE